MPMNSMRAGVSMARARSARKKQAPLRIAVNRDGDFGNARANLPGADENFESGPRGHFDDFISPPACSTIRTGGFNLGRAEKLRTSENAAESSWQIAVQAAESKQSRNLVVLDVRACTSYTDYFVICIGANSRQIQAIADEVEQKLKNQGEYPTSIEGYENAEWVLVDYGDFVVHIFSEKARTYYDLERLWRDARVVDL